MPDNSLERHNLAQIEALNQRGDRMLSVVDLLLAGTMNLEMAALLCALVGRGASFLSGAVPGGAGKTTVMAALLAFLPPGVEIITVDSERALADAAPANERGTRRCYLAHEIGAGGWYGYIWGRAVRDYLNLARRGHMIGTGLHADATLRSSDASSLRSTSNLAQLRQILLAPPLEVGEEALAALGFVLFLAAERRGSGIRRRVSTVHAGARADAPVLFRWDRESDTFRHGGESPQAAVAASRKPNAVDLDAHVPPPERAALRQLLEDLARRKVTRLEQVRAAYLESLAPREARR